MENLNRPEIVDELSAKFKMSKSKVNRLLDAYQDMIMNGVSEGKTVKITGFATFNPSIKAERDIVDPKTGVSHHFPARKSVRIRPLLKFTNLLKEKDGSK